jgi:hypothetical protein
LFYLKLEKELPKNHSSWGFLLNLSQWYLSWLFRFLSRLFSVEANLCHCFYYLLFFIITSWFPLPILIKIRCITCSRSHICGCVRDLIKFTYHSTNSQWRPYKSPDYVKLYFLQYFCTF